MIHGSFVAALTCMDGRIQDPVARLLRERFPVEFVDTITEPGIVRFLAENVPSEPSRDWLRRKLDLSVTKHEAQAIAVVAHKDCAGHPVSDEDQRRQLATAAALVGSWFPSVVVAPVWVAPDKTGSWQARLLTPYVA